MRPGLRSSPTGAFHPVRVRFLFAIAAILGLLAVPTWSTAQTTINVTVNPCISFQTMDGIGALWIDPNYQRPPLPPVQVTLTQRQAMWNDMHNVLGFTVSRTDINNGENPNDNGDPLNINWPGFSFNLEATPYLKDYLNAAPALGLNTFFLDGHYIKNLKTHAPYLVDRLGNLASGMEAELAEYLFVKILHHTDQGYALPLSGIMCEGNETITPEQMTLTIKLLGRLLAAAGKQTKIMAADDASTYQSLQKLQHLVTDREALGYVDVFAYRAYYKGWSEPAVNSCYGYGPPNAWVKAQEVLDTSGRDQVPAEKIADRATLRDLAQSHGKRLWMTESSAMTFDTIPQESLARSNHLHDELTLAHVNMFMYMGYYGQTYEGKYDWPDGGPLQLYLDANGNYVSHVITKMGYFVQKFARSIRPGAVRVSATTDQTGVGPKVRVTAFRSPTPGQLTVIAINNHATTQRAKVIFNQAVVRVSGNAVNPQQDDAPVAILEQGATHFTADLPYEGVAAFQVTVQ